MVFGNFQILGHDFTSQNDKPPSLANGSYSSPLIHIAVVELIKILTLVDSLHSIRRISIARGTLNKMKSTLTNSHINLESKKRILKCNVWSTLYYGIETWTVTTTLEKRLEAFEM